MEQTEEYLDCVCGKKHFLRTTNIVVKPDAFLELIDTINKSDYKHILVLCNNDNDLAINLKQSINSSKTLSIIFMPNASATLALCDKLEDKGQDLVVAIGSDELISIAKYYSYCYQSDLFIFPIYNFTDYTFSCFSRLFDGVVFDFYKAKEPKEIYVCTVVNKYNVFQSHYIASKYIAKIDNEIASLVFKTEHCPRLIDNFNSILDEYKNFKKASMSDQNIKNIWTLIRLGQSMSFFEQTKYFFGGEKALVDLLNTKRINSDFLELSSFASKIIVNAYCNFFKTTPAKGSYNINKHIASLSEFLNVKPSEVIKRLAPSNLLCGDSEIFARFNNYYPYISRQINLEFANLFYLQSSLSITTNVLAKNRLDAMLIEKSVGLSADLLYKPTGLHLICMYGYLDKLL